MKDEFIEKKVKNDFFKIIIMICSLPVILFILIKFIIKINEDYVKKETVIIKKEEKKDYPEIQPFKKVEIKNYGDLDLSIINKNNIQVINNSNLTVNLKEYELSECNEIFVFHSKQNCKGN